MSLEALARAWIADYWDAEHLRRTHAWLAVLAPEASEALRLAALTHDMERHFPGGPVADADRPPWDRAYRDAHAGRSATIVAGWLREHKAPEGLIEHTAALIRLHERGGMPEADLLQAADSLSFLEVNGALLAARSATGGSRRLVPARSCGGWPIASRSRRRASPPGRWSPQPSSSSVEAALAPTYLELALPGSPPRFSGINTVAGSGCTLSGGGGEGGDVGLSTIGQVTASAIAQRTVCRPRASTAA